MARGIDFAYSSSSALDAASRYSFSFATELPRQYETTDMATPPVITDAPVRMLSIPPSNESVSTVRIDMIPNSTIRKPMGRENDARYQHYLDYVFA